MAKTRGVSENSEPASAIPKTPQADLDATIYGIRWPANRLTFGQLKTLRQISKDVRVPITHLLKDAVDVYLSLIQRELQAAMVAEQEHGEPQTQEEPSACLAPSEPHTSDLIPPQPADENSPTGAPPSSSCLEITKLIAECTSNPETELPEGVDLSAGPKTQLNFIFSGD